MRLAALGLASSLACLLAGSPAFAVVDPYETRLNCAHLLQNAEAVHAALLAEGAITPLEAERTILVPGFITLPNAHAWSRAWRPRTRDRDLAVAIKPSGEAVLLETGGPSSTARAPLAEGVVVEVPWYGRLRPGAEGRFEWDQPLPVLPLGDVTRRDFYERFQGALAPLVASGRLLRWHMNLAIVRTGTFRGEALHVLRLLPEGDSRYLAFVDESGSEFMPSPTWTDEYIALKNGERLGLDRNRWWIYFPRGLAREFGAAAKFPSWKEFLDQYPEALDELTAQPFLAADLSLPETYVQPATDEADGSRYLLVIFRPETRFYGQTPPASFALWDPERRQWVDVRVSRRRTFRLENERRVGLHVAPRYGWSELPSVSEVESFARSF